MGLIDSEKAIKALTHWETEATDEEIIYTINNLPTVEAIPKDQYETRLKADLVAMLTELQLEIEEMDSREHECHFATQWCINRDTVIEIIQEKIDKLKAKE